MHAAVILSLKRGMEHFVYRELSTIADQGATLSLFPTKKRVGLYNPKPEWIVVYWNPLLVLLYQPIFAFWKPKKYFSLLLMAIRFGAIMDFLIAWYFSSQMNNVDVIYSVFGDHKFFIGYFCKEILNKPLVVTIHAYELYKNPNEAFFRNALQHCDQVITVTEYNKEILQAKFGLEADKIKVVRIGVDIEKYNPVKKFIVLIVAYFNEKKGHDILFRAIKELAANDIEIWVVGDEGGEGDALVDVKKLAKDLGVDKQVAFFGNLGGNALRGLYQACDVFCLPSRHDRFGVAEGFPTVLAEAMAFGKPVITSRHVEIPRIIDEILVDENDVHGLAQALNSAYQSMVLRDQLGKKSRATAEKFFSARNAERTFHILNELSTRNENGTN